MTRFTLSTDDSQFLEFEATMSEDHASTATVTSHPIEGGADQADHIRDEPDTITLRGIVSDTPILILSSLTARASVPGGDPRSRAQDAYNFVKRLKKQRKLWTVASSLEEYQDMAITSVSVLRDKETSNIVALNVSFQQVPRARTEQQAAPVTEKPERKQESNDGKKTKRETQSEKAENSSFLYDQVSASP